MCVDLDVRAWTIGWHASPEGRPRPARSFIGRLAISRPSSAKKEGSGSREYLLQDPTFGADLWISRAAWTTESDAVLPRSRGRASCGLVGGFGGSKATSLGEGQRSNGGLNQGAERGVASRRECWWGSGLLRLADTTIHDAGQPATSTDTPLGLLPAIGPPRVSFPGHYNQRRLTSPGFRYSNLGRQVDVRLVSYVEDDPEEPSARTRVVSSGEAGRSPTRPLLRYPGTSELRRTTASRRWSAQLVRPSLRSLRSGACLMAFGTVSQGLLPAGRRPGLPTQGLPDRLVDPQGNR